MSTKTVYIFRHGETDWNKARRLQGSTDIPLNETGRVQALRLQEFFRSNPVDVFLSSDLSRAAETARIAAGDLPAKLILEPRLRESGLGEAEGLSLIDVVEQFGQDAWDDWYGIEPDKWNASFPGGETKAQHLERMVAGLEDFLAQTDAQKIGVATHGGSIRRLIHHFRPDLTTAIVTVNCALYEMTFNTQTRLWTVNIEAKCVKS